MGKGYEAIRKGGVALLALTALILSAQLALPMPGGIPISLQTLAVLLLAWWLGPVRGLGVVGLYLLMGGLGMPVFARGGSGWETLSGPGGGFLLGFAVAVLGVGYVAKKTTKTSFLQVSGIFLLGHAIILLLGLAWLLVLRGPAGLWEKVVFPLLPGLLVKTLLGAACVWGVARLQPLRRKISN